MLAGVVMVLLASPAVYGLLGSLVGGSIAGSVSLLVAWQTRRTAEQAWVRDNRHQIYAEFLANAQAFLNALVKCERVEEASNRFVEPWGVVQTVAGPEVFEEARTYGYRLVELKDEHDAKNPSGPKYFHSVANLVRQARHATIAAMRSELELPAAAFSDDYNGFVGTTFEAEYRAAVELRGGAGKEQRPVY
jgi:hypothetical protein